MTVLCNIINYFVVFNGIYDIICGLSIIFLYETYIFSNIAKLHMNMFHNHCKHKDSMRYLGYWIMTYGCIRLFSFTNHPFLTALSYFIEAIVFFNESIFYNKVIESKMLIVSSTSCMIGIIILVVNYI